jgi:nucleoside-diphosphate-sugar epimerase
MKVLFIGGTGVISSACLRPAIEAGAELYLYNRGNAPQEVPEGVTLIQGDIRDRKKSEEQLRGRSFDVVVQWVGFTEEHIERDIELFAGRTGQYIFISSASAYHKPPAGLPITESSLLRNPYWEYSRNKIACEQRLERAYRETGFPVTILRPSHTYGDKMIPSPFDRGATIVARMRRGKEVIVPGDGTSRWVLTHNSDFAKGFVGLLGNPRAIGEVYHITSQEALTWDQIHSIIAGKLGTVAKIVHIPADFICHHYPEFTGPLLGDKIHSLAFDNSKISRLVPGFRCTTPFHLGIEASLRRLEEREEEALLDAELERTLDDLIDRYRRAW